MREPCWRWGGRWMSCCGVGGELSLAGENGSLGLPYIYLPPTVCPTLFTLSGFLSMLSSSPSCVFLLVFLFLSQSIEMLFNIPIFSHIPQEGTFDVLIQVINPRWFGFSPTSAFDVTTSFKNEAWRTELAYYVIFLLSWTGSDRCKNAETARYEGGKSGGRTVENAPTSHRKIRELVSGSSSTLFHRRPIQQQKNPTTKIPPNGSCNTKT